MQPQQERLTVTGELPAAAIAPVQDAGWRTVPRTEAAVRSGMALYGLEGLEPVLTTISLDNRVVRTLYRLGSGSTVELEQQRAAAPAVSSLQATSRALPQRTGAAIAADIARPQPQVWSDVRDGIRLSMQTASASPDLATLGGQLRID
jgi:hypothetical protein